MNEPAGAQCAHRPPQALAWVRVRRARLSDWGIPPGARQQEPGSSPQQQTIRVKLGASPIHAHDCDGNRDSQSPGGSADMSQN